MTHRKGDTLIEVALAIGVFSLVAITVVSVVSASLTNAQSALEITLVREELDAQAEALRFIHESYINGSQSAVENTVDNPNPYENLWNRIVKNNLTTYSTDNQKNAVLRYSPATCSDVFDDANGTVRKPTGGIDFKPFIINTRKLHNPGDPNSTIVTSNFHTPTTYPQILYNWQTGNESLDEQAKYSGDIITNIQGIYIIAVQGTDGALVSGGDVIQPNHGKVTYYDFYIRSCWMPPNSDRASTISTVVRLYDPAAIDY